MKKKGNITLVCVAAALVLLLSALCYLLPKPDYSVSERRKLKSLPTLSWKTLSSGRFMADFEDYALDVFPFRDGFRSLKAAAARYAFGRQDNNGVYMADGYISKQEYPLNQASLDKAAAMFRRIYDSYLADKNTAVYFSIIPDKNYFLAQENGQLSLDYPSFFDSMKSGTDFMTYIDILPLLEIGDYYKTDVHWRQESLTDVAQLLASEMGADFSGNFTEKTLDTPFYGVYYGQSALPHAPDALRYLTSNTLEGCLCHNHETGRTGGVYDLKKAGGSDPYELFLSGPLSLLTVENPAAKTDKRLVVFRDSFASSLTPLLLEGYAQVTLVDIRYISAKLACRMLDFQDCDVLFLYSTLVLNHSENWKP